MPPYTTKRDGVTLVCMEDKKNNPALNKEKQGDETKKAEKPEKKPVEIGGPAGPEPTRYGDWEQKGRCTDF